MTYHTCYPFGSECPACEEEVRPVREGQWAKVWFEAADGTSHTFEGHIRYSADRRYIYVGEDGSIPMWKVQHIDEREPTDVERFITP